METRKMSKKQIDAKVKEHAEKLEELGMDRMSACAFVSSVMNLGIAAQEQWNSRKQK